MKALFNKYDLCPCNSGKKAKFCCLEANKWNKKPTILKIKNLDSKYSNDKCYAKKIENCSSKISREHVISKNILEDLELNNKIKPFQNKFELIENNKYQLHINI